MFLLFSAVQLTGKPSIITERPACFTENKGQLKALENSVIKFYSHSGCADVFFKPGSISFRFIEHVFNKDISEATGLSFSSSSGIKVQRVEMVFLNANINAIISGSQKSDFYENYYLSNLPERGITRASCFGILKYTDIYPHIDLLLYAQNQGLKYEFVVRPGGSVSKIQIQWRGAELLYNNNAIQYRIREYGNISETNLRCLQDGAELKSAYRLKRNTISFDIAQYNPKKILVIDPEIKWTTYFGGSGDEEGRGIATDSLGNVYVTGWTSSNALIATTGADQPVFGGFYDAFLSKFSRDGKLIWSTYFGSAENENGYGIAIDKTGGVYICGSSPGSGLATPGAYQAAPAGFTDAFLAKFDAEGFRKWSTYYGGSSDDQALGIATDIFSNVYITGFTMSASGIATPGAYNTKYGGSRDNGFLAKFDSSGHLKWGTYFGGDQNDYSFAVATDLQGNVCIAGTASSGTGIASSGAFRSSVGGFYDGFLAKFTGAGALLWGTYFGNDGDDECTALGINAKGDIYIAGNTSSSHGIATNGAHQELYAGGAHGYDVFLAKFNEDGNQLWSTYYGGSDDDFAWGLDVNKNGYVFITGYTYSDTGIAGKGVYQPAISGINDAFVTEFNPAGTPVWATYFGGKDKDFGYAVKSDPFNDVYITGVTYSKDGIAVPGSWHDTLSGITDAFLAKFSPQVTGIAVIREDKFNLQVYPNPLAGNAVISFELPEHGRIQLDLFDASGRKTNLMPAEIKEIGAYRYVIDTAALKLKTGSYVLKITVNDQTACKSLIKL
jgi:hypothetical protein